MGWEVFDTPKENQPDLDATRSGHSVTLVGHILLVLGGVLDEQDVGLTDDCNEHPYFALDTRTKEWHKLDADDELSQRFAYHTAHLVGDKVCIVFGRETSHLTYDEMEMRIYDPILREVYREQLGGPAVLNKRKGPARCCHVSEYFEKKHEILVFGGKDVEDQDLGDLLAIDVQSKQLRVCPMKGEVPLAQSLRMSTLCGDNMIVFAHSSSTPNGMLYVLNNSKSVPAWSKLTWSKGPQAISGGTLNLLGSVLILFGGEIGTTAQRGIYSCTLGRSTCEWLPRGEHNAVAKHRGIAVNTEMYFIGGLETALRSFRTFVLAN